jgi:hypothetical protein
MRVSGKQNLQTRSFQVLRVEIHRELMLVILIFLILKNVVWQEVVAQ